ncbi:MAG: hypothetical protein QM845_02435 [Verrucomicrobiota bacterium]|nr:hypothetical protein [Verrucomicrobiota bacterium]
MTALKKFIHDMGVSNPTVWRWRKLGWLDTVNIAGRPYVTQEAVQIFKERAARGEFAKHPIVPAPQRRG